MDVMLDIKYFLTIPFLFLSGCGESGSNYSVDSGKDFKKGDYVSYSGGDNIKEFNLKYGKQCGTQFACLLEGASSDTPLKKYDGKNLCINGRYEYNSVSKYYFDMDGYFVGAVCEVSESDYYDVGRFYNSSDFYKKYSNQRGVLEDFKTWRTDYGFVTTFKELIGRTSSGIGYQYYIYFGKKEHPHYSQY